MVSSFKELRAYNCGLYLFSGKLSKNGDADSMECFVCFKTINTQELSAHIEQHNPYNATKVSGSPSN